MVGKPLGDFNHCCTNNSGLFHHETTCLPYQDIPENREPRRHTRREFHLSNDYFHHFTFGFHLKQKQFFQAKKQKYRKSSLPLRYFFSLQRKNMSKKLVSILAVFVGISSCSLVKQPVNKHPTMKRLPLLTMLLLIFFFACSSHSSHIESDLKIPYQTFTVDSATTIYTFMKDMWREEGYIMCKDSDTTYHCCPLKNRYRSLK